MSKVTTYLRGHLLGEVSVNPRDRKALSTDNGVLELESELVLYPRNTNDIRKIARFSWQLAEKGHIMPIGARGNGQDTTGASLTKGVSVDLSRHMRRIYEYDSKQRLVRLQPGASCHAVTEALTLQGAAIMPFIDIPDSTAGGAVANYTSGPLAGKYGSVASAVDKVEVVLANGDVLQTGRISKKELERKKGIQGFEGDIYRGIDGLIEDNQAVLDLIAPEDASGYGGVAYVKEKNGSFDLTPLIIGSQGTLAIISEMIMKAEFRSLHTDIAVLVFDSAEKAHDTIDMLEKLQPAYVEYYDARLFETAIKAGRTYPFFSDTTGAKAVLVAGFDDFSDRHREKALKKAAKIAQQAGANCMTGEGVKALDLESARDVVRYTNQSDSGSTASPDVFGRFFVPKVRFEDFTNGLADLEKRLHCDLPITGYCLSGSYAVHPEIALGKTEGKQRLLKLLDELSKLVTEHGGSFITDGGEGRLKARFASQVRDATVNQLYVDIKKVFDPYGILAPGVMFDTDIKSLISLLK